jgi:protein tyrosine phosphatase
VAPYIRECIERTVGVLVSAHELKDANPRECGKFWDQTVLSRLDLGGWSIEVKEMNTTLQGTMESCKGQIPAIEVTFLHATHPQKPSHTMVHLYITGWVDRTIVSDENLVLTLLKLMQLFSSGPVAVNCAAGRGRSLTIGLVFAQIRQIYETWVHGGDIENMAINVPELVYHISQQRDLDLRNTPVERVCPTFLQMLSLINAYAQWLLTAKFYRKK